MSLTVHSRQLFVLGAISGALTFVAPMAARADDPPPGWSGKGQAGYLQSRGNSDSDAANAALDVFLKRGDWLHEGAADGLYGKSAGIVSAERWDVRLQSNYNFTQRMFTFGALSYLDDRFSGFEYQASATGGIGYKFINSSSTRLNGQIGLGYRSSRPEILVKDTDGAVVTRILEDRQSNAVGTAGIDFEHDFNKLTKITDKLLVESGSADTSIKNVFALEVKMSNTLALAAGYTVQDNTKPPPGAQKTDRTTTLNVVYAFGQRASPTP